MSEFMDELLSDDERFQVTDDQKALWCIKRLKEGREERDKFILFYQEQIKKLQEETAKREEYFESLLSAYFDTVPHKVTKTQESYVLPGAKLVRKPQNPTYERDNDKLLSFLQASGRTECIIPVPATEKPSWEKYKAFTDIVDGVLVDKQTGEVVEGVTVTINPDKLEVKIDD